MWNFIFLLEQREEFFKRQEEERSKLKHFKKEVDVYNIIK